MYTICPLVRKDGQQHTGFFHLLDYPELAAGHASSTSQCGMPWFRW
jgi:hypothetical protein